MIKRIELINFMSHAHTVIEPAAGLTVLVGPNNCGKSALVAALQILCHNDNSTYVLRHGAKDCQIIVETEEGHVIEWSRKKSGSPKYTINGKPFDRLNRNVPPELHAALRLPKVTSDRQEFDVHFGEQKRPVFLLNDSAGSAAEFFASSSDAIRLVEMQALHKQQVRDAKRDQANFMEEKRSVEAKLQILAPIKQLESSIRDTEKQFVQLGIDLERIAAIGELIASMVGCHKNLLYHESLVGCFERLSAPPDFQNTRELEDLVRLLAANIVKSDRAAAASDAFATLAQPPYLDDEPGLEKLIDDIVTSLRRVERDEAKFASLRQLEPAPVLEPTEPLGELISAFTRQQELVNELNKQLDEISRDLDRFQDDILAWAQANPVCPTCKGPVAAKNLVPLTNHNGGRE